MVPICHCHFMTSSGLSTNFDAISGKFDIIIYLFSAFEICRVNPVLVYPVFWSPVSFTEYVSNLQYKYVYSCICLSLYICICINGRNLEADISFATTTNFKYTSKIRIYTHAMKLSSVFITHPNASTCALAAHTRSFARQANQIFLLCTYIKCDLLHTSPTLAAMPLSNCTCFTLKQLFYCVAFIFWSYFLIFFFIDIIVLNEAGLI